MHTFYDFFVLFWMTVVVGADLLMFRAIVVASAHFALLVRFGTSQLKVLTRLKFNKM